MRLPAERGHLTYCTNIHPGETWAEVRRNVDEHVTAVKALVAPTQRFGVGLRLSAAAAESLDQPATLAGFRGALQAAGLYVFTINGFPFGTFHGIPVKEQVYRPDWLEDERVAYTDRLAHILAALLPEGEGLEGSISTVPGCFRPRGAGPRAPAEIAGRLLRSALTLWRLREAGRPTIALALEPEPECLLETTRDAIRFFESHLFSRAAVEAFSRESGLGAAASEEALRRHLGVCLDACHAAVEFEDPIEAVDSLERAGIRIAKLQVSAGLKISRPDARALASLARFAEGVYLHQVVIRRGSDLERVLDLPMALAAASRGDQEVGDEWRVHFHVPLFRDRLGPFENTQEFLVRLLQRHRDRPFTQHVEVETYTWDVLPEEYRSEPVVGAIARELSWTSAHLSEEAPT